MIPHGTVHVPGDKSISHRALMLAALADGVSTIQHLLDSADVRSTAGVLRAMGTRIDVTASSATVIGRGLRGLSQPMSDLDCGNSGTTTRLVAGIVAGHALSARFVGDASLSARPMKRVAEPLTLMGAHVSFERSDGLPMTVDGNALRSIGYTTRSASAQVKSAVLLAALVARVPVAVTEPTRSRDHTERMLLAQGVDLTVDGTTVTMGVARRLAPLQLLVPGDPSSAAFFIALAAMVEGSAIDLPGVCLNATRTGFFAAVQRMGAVLVQADRSEVGAEVTGTVRATGSGTLMGITVGADEIPSMIDELPLLGCLAARASGTTLLEGAGELRHKETDRIATLVKNLCAIGVEAEELPDGFRITGSQAPLRGRVDPQGDHRIAMAFGVLGALPGNDIVVAEPDCVGVSYPDFWRDLTRVTR